MSNYWQRQDPDKPLFPDLIWSRPQNKNGAGKLLIIGGQAQEFSHVAAAYAAAEKAGAGTVRVIMPESTRKVTKMLPNIEYAPGNSSGSFAKTALSNFFEASEWADHVLLAGDLGRSSETTTVIDGYLLRCMAPVTIAESALASTNVPAEQLLQRPVNIILGAKRLQKLGTELELTTAITSETGAIRLSEILHKITSGKKGSLVTEHGGFTWVSSAGQVSGTSPDESNQTILAVKAAVWTMQNPGKIFEALTTSLVR